MDDVDEHDDESVASEDERGRGSSHPALPMPAVVGGLALAGCAFLPLTTDGLSFWNLFTLLLRSDPASALVFGITLGAPFLFGAAVALGGLAARSGSDSEPARPTPTPAPSSPVDRLGRSAVHGVLALLHAELVVVAGVVFRVGTHRWLAALLFGFALVSGVYFAYRSARAAAEAMDHADRMPSLWWMARWGSSVIVVLGVWLRVLAVFGAPFGIAVDVATLCALAVASTLYFARRV